MHLGFKVPSQQGKNFTSIRIIVFSITHKFNILLLFSDLHKRFKIRDNGMKTVTATIDPSTLKFQNWIIVAQQMLQLLFKPIHENLSNNNGKIYNPFCMFKKCKYKIYCKLTTQILKKLLVTKINAQSTSEFTNILFHINKFSKGPLFILQLPFCHRQSRQIYSKKKRNAKFPKKR